MNPTSLTRRTLTFVLLLAFSFTLVGPMSLVPSVEAASSSASKKLVSKLKKQIGSLERQFLRLNAQLSATDTRNLDKASRALRNIVGPRNTASASRLKRISKKLKHLNAMLKRQLAAARPSPPTPAAFIEMVTVGNAGNAADSTTYGAVPYEYSIGKYEVTLAQYTVFLSAVAATDSFSLYNVSMATDLNGAGITQSGSSGSFTYSVIGDGARPVTYVSWFDAARFCNWLHNGRPSGAQTAATTENGAYPLNGAITGVTITRQWGAKFWIPSEDEWYKAAYHQPTGQLGDVDDYWLYPTKSNALPGNTIGASANHANFFTSVFSVTQSGSFDSNQNYLTAVGSYPGSASFYGTFDQGGNVFEWNDAVISGSFRGLRGGSWDDGGEFLLRSSNRGGGFPAVGSGDFGFRVASP
jgi:formylglycine-generating enzyme